MAKNHALLLGKLIGNLHSLETLLRVFLNNKNLAASPGIPMGKSHFQLQVGDFVPENAFTNFDSFGALVSKYNNAISQKNVTLRVDDRVVRIRDLLAHGRVSADSIDASRLAIIKFEKPTKGHVRVSDSALMTEWWFQEHIDLVRAQIEKVDQALKKSA